jgi:hypothetical protein
MQILQHTSTNLVIYSRPIWLWLFASTSLVFAAFPIREIIQQYRSRTVRFGSILFLAIVIISILGNFFDSTEIMTSTFDKNRGVVTIREQGLLGTKVSKYLLTDIKDAIAINDDSDDMATKPVRLLLASGRQLPVSRELGLFNSQQKAQATANLIRDFLNS